VRYQEALETSLKKLKAATEARQRCGFTREDVLRSHLPFKGGRRDTVVFSLLPGELR
jgi:RimJ/RimL family protein N-acetyltransferase